MSFFEDLDLDAILEKSSRKDNFAKKWFIKEDELDDNQREILREESDYILVTGCAGSGKSILLLHKLFKLLVSKDEDYDSYLVTMYTKALRVFFKDGIDIFLKENEEFKHLYNKKIKKNNIMHTEKIETDGFKENKEYLFIDEYQDIPKKIFNKLVGKFEKVLIFGDEEQRLYDEDDYIDAEYIKQYLNEEIKIYNLNITYRLPFEIANYAQEIINSNISSKCCNKGISNNLPYVIECEPTEGKEYFENEIEFVVKEIKEKDLKDVGVLIHNNESLRKAREIFEEKIKEIYGKKILINIQS